MDYDYPWWFPDYYDVRGFYEPGKPSKCFPIRLSKETIEKLKNCKHNVIGTPERANFFPVGLSKETKKKFESCRNDGESYEDVVRRLLVKRLSRNRL